MDINTILANTARTFTVNSKQYNIKAMNMLQLASIRQRVIEQIKSDYKKDAIELAQGMPEKDRSKFLFDALRGKVIEEAEINASMSSGKGIVMVLAAAMQESVEYVEKLIGEQTDGQVLVDIFNFVLQVEEPDEKKAEQTTAG